MTLRFVGPMIIGAAIALLCTACSSSNGVSLAKAISAEQGIIGLEVASSDLIRAVSLRGTDGEQLTMSPSDGKEGFLLFRVGRGRYCLSEAYIGYSKINLKHYGGDVCFESVVGAIGYIGHYLFTPFAKRHVTRFDRFSVFRRRFKERYPALAAKYRLIDLLQLKSVRDSTRVMPGNRVARTKEVVK